MVDSLALNHVAQNGWQLSPTCACLARSASSCSSTTFGLMVRTVDRSTILVGVTLLGLLAAWSLSLRSQPTSSAGTPHPLAGLRLLRDNKDLRWLLAATGLHWMACTPYNGMLAIHVLALGLSPSVVGICAGLGVASEVAAMLLYPRFAERIAPRHLLGLSFVLERGALGRHGDRRRRRAPWWRSRCSTR